MRIAVTGKSGQLVTAMQERGGDATILPVGRPELDLRHAQDASAMLASLRPDALISAAAYTSVDKAENDAEEARLINSEAPAYLAAAAHSLGIPIVHISTDYVFDGSKAVPYVETDPTAPLGVYGSTKLAGERAVADATDDYAILRTAWVYSAHGANFLKTMLRLAGDRPELRVVGDQVGNPTSAYDLADAVLQVANNLVSAPGDANLRGVFHATASGEASWADFAREIMASSASLGGPTAGIVSITTADYPTPALRPENSRLDCTRLRQAHQVSLRDWRSSTRAVTAKLLGGHS